eukprot:Gregarina_sp_Poly_1__2086@NODE_154_length_12409_cov_137_944904_g136_i0_p7_GENE_NODE_154_length_12409_cov_137_944904_g136_i0NODE_154_length_12409_cov_137_944904_g136_i0_p7_ORF_typecomplete_len271_score25_88Rer1/PF03248_13/2_2e52DUF3270/PF11674_8/0_033DUF3270/PF11674_8/5_8e03DUF1453/PF07301_11/0_095DUF1453/PF07301_11/6_1e03_NODE_154_length_12409_cov_137_944904_g136_i077348546
MDSRQQRPLAVPPELLERVPPGSSFSPSQLATYQFGGHPHGTHLSAATSMPSFVAGSPVMEQAAAGVRTADRGVPQFRPGSLQTANQLPPPLRKWYLAYSTLVDRTTLWFKTRWLVFFVAIALFCIRIILRQGFYISAYALGIYQLSLFVGFLSPQKDRETESYILPLSGQESGEYRPFLRKIPEFSFWYLGLRATLLALLSTAFDVLDLPVFWPVLVFYFCFLFFMMMKQQIKEMLAHGYIPFSGKKAKYADVGTDPIRRAIHDRKQQD